MLPVVLSSPGVMYAAVQVAQALREHGMLARYESTTALDPQGALLRTVEGAGTVGTRLRPQLLRRALPGVPGRLVRNHPGWEVLRTLAGLAGASEVVQDRLWERMVLRFDAAVARGLSAVDGAVYGYEHACRASFTRARELGVRRIFDLASPHHTFMDRLLARQAEEFPETRTAHYAATRPLAGRRNAHKQAELELAELVVANSSFTARTLLDTGYPPQRVRVVPLGAPPVDPSWRSAAGQGPVRFLFAGTASVRKGVHVLLDAWKRLQPGAGATLTLAGQWTLPEAMRRGLPESVHIAGSLPRAELQALYRESSVLAFPSLADGFAMVVTEAMSHGLPVIVTRHVGAADLVREGENGWVLEPGDVEALTERMQWCIDHPAELHAMREAAEATAAAHGWDDYRRRLVRAICEHFGEPCAEPSNG
jgi:glycosyltransferase involved in cell wall biosynthesis